MYIPVGCFIQHRAGNYIVKAIIQYRSKPTCVYILLEAGQTANMSFRFAWLRFGRKQANVTSIFATRESPSGSINQSNGRRNRLAVENSSARIVHIRNNTAT